jgi:chemotaxis protein methyltransferase CheR
MRNEPRFYDAPYPFDYLRERILATHPLGRPVRALCAACGTGEAAYTVAMVLSEQLADRVAWEVVATDASAADLQVAQAGIYDLSKAEVLPRGYLTRFCLRGVRAQDGRLCITPAVRERIRFRQADLGPRCDLLAMGEFDVIFWLRALRLEGEDARRRAATLLAAQLRRGGYLVSDQLEALANVSNVDGVGALRPAAPSVYFKEGP